MSGQRFNHDGEDRQISQATSWRAERHRRRFGHDVAPRGNCDICVAHSHWGDPHHSGTCTACGVKPTRGAMDWSKAGIQSKI